MDTLTIGQLAKKTQVGIETIRFYEREGLLPQPERTPGGYRKFSGDAVARLQFIQRAKKLGFTLREIRELLNLRLDPNTTCEDIRTQAGLKKTEIENKIQDLEKMRQVLEKLIRECENTDKTVECPILEVLENESTL